MNLVILGLPGAGKGTHAQRLKEELQMCHLSSGEVLKRAIQQETEAGNKARTYVTSGDLVPDRIVINLMADEISKYNEHPLLFDGFPRTLRQAHRLDEIMKKHDKFIDLSIYLEVKKDNLLKRISGRRICSREGTVYHIDFNPPQEDGICDRCGAPLLQREDDKQEIVKKRIEESEKRISKIVKYYQKKNILKKINGTDRSPDQVHGDVQKAVHSYLEQLKH